MTVTPFEASNAGQTTIEHAETLFEGTFSSALNGVPLHEAINRWRTSPAAQELFATFVKNGTVVDPTLVAGRWQIAWFANPIEARDRYVGVSSRPQAAASLDSLRPEAAKLLAERGPVVRELEAVVAQMHRAGVPLVTGTDLSFLYGPGSGFDVADELQAFVDVGLTPAEAIRAATLNPARLFPALDAGEIAPGRRANLLLLDANPLQDIRNVTRIRAVVLSGRLYDRAALDKLLADAAAQATVH
jgi:imidazolonepropionase-like amidohydrolase